MTSGGVRNLCVGFLHNISFVDGEPYDDQRTEFLFDFI